MGRMLIGIGALLLVLGIFAVYESEPWGIVAPLWLILNIIMGIDMVVLNSKRTQAITQASTKKCPRCAETIQRDAKICRFCNHSVE